MAITGRRPRNQYWEKLIAVISSKLSDWQTNFLSLGGRLMLVNSILSVISTYWMPIFKLHIWVIKAIERIWRDFLWRGTDLDNPKCQLVNWKCLCQPEEQGWWRIINLEDFNTALLGKWWWKCVQNKDWCGRIFIQFNYFCHAPFYSLFLRHSK